MKALRELWMLRRQSGKVKLALLLFGLAGTILASLGAQAGGFAAKVNQPVEYVLSSGTAGPVLDAKLRQLQEEPGVAAASRQREYSLTNGGRSITVAELSEEYLARCFGLTGSGASQDFWLDPAAFRNFLGNGAQSPARLACQGEDGTVNGTFQMAESLAGREAQAVARGSSVTLAESGTVRVMLERASGNGTARLEALGFAVVNREKVLEQNYETELLMARLGWGLLSAALAVAAGRLLFREGKREILGK